MRHVAYVNAVRINLRHGRYANAPTDWDDIETFLPSGEMEEIKKESSIPNALAERQTRRLAQLTTGGIVQQRIQVHLQQVIDRFG